MLKKLALASFPLIFSALPALAGVIVNSPGNNSTVGSPFNLSANASTCSSQNIASMGYSLDSSTSTTILYSASINTSVWAAPGGHTVHVKAWGNGGAVCVTDVAVTVATTSLVPSNALSVSSIQALGSWIDSHDTGTPGGSTGYMTIVSSPSRSGAARQLSTSYSYYGGQRYTVTFGDDESAYNFLFDVWVYLAYPSNGVQNLELDLNQVLSNGQTMLYGFQCDGWSGTWDFSVNRGTPSSPYVQWVNTSAACSPRSWGANEWHHIQISYSRNDSGWVTYKSVWLDGNQSNINVTAFSEYAMGWAPTLLANVQIDGSSSGTGSSTVFVDDMTVYRW